MSSLHRISCQRKKSEQKENKRKRRETMLNRDFVFHWRELLELVGVTEYAKCINFFKVVVIYECKNPVQIIVVGILDMLSNQFRLTTAVSFFPYWIIYCCCCLTLLTSWGSLVRSQEPELSSKPQGIIEDFFSPFPIHPWIFFRCNCKIIASRLGINWRVYNNSTNDRVFTLINGSSMYASLNP